MLIKAAILWVLGLLTIVPYGTYYLLFHAERDQYALLITLVLFWIFGYWGVAGPVLGVITTRRIFRAIEQASSREELLQTLQSDEARRLAIDAIASDNGIPRFMARWIYRSVMRRLPEIVGGSEARAIGADSARTGR